MSTTFPQPDGYEARTAFYDEESLSRETVYSFPDDPPLTDAERILELKALLADIHLGTTMMLEPAVGLKGAILDYVREVRRVSAAGRDI